MMKIPTCWTCLFTGLAATVMGLTLSACNENAGVNADEPTPTTRPAETSDADSPPGTEMSAAAGTGQTGSAAADEPDAGMGALPDEPDSQAGADQQPGAGGPVQKDEFQKLIEQLSARQADGDADAQAEAEAAIAAGDLPGRPVEGQPVTTDSGLKYYDLQAGEGPQPENQNDRVRVHYTGYLLDGTKFDSSRDRGEPIEFDLDGVIRGWSEGVASMKVGGVRKLIVPPNLGYGAQGHPPVIPANSTLVFDVELLGLPDYASIPDELPGEPVDGEPTITDSGLRLYDLREGDGPAPQGETDLVRVHYNFYRNDGELLGSTYERGSPQTLRLNALFPGFTEGVGSMRVGGQRKIIIPSDLTGDQPLATLPGDATLIFDVELLGLPEWPGEPVEGEPTVTESGLRYYDLATVEEGPTPGADPDQYLSMHYTVYTAEGDRQGSSRDTGGPQIVPMSGLFPGFAEGVQSMSVGSQRKLIIPPDLGPEEGDLGDATLVIDVELAGLPDFQAVPDELPGAPVTGEQQTTERGVAWYPAQWRDGSTTTPPDPQATPRGVGDLVQVHYDAYFAIGEQLGSTRERNRPEIILLGQGFVPGLPEAPGFTDVVADMHVGEVRKLVLIGEHAFGEQIAQLPKNATLIIDVELVGLPDLPGEPVSGEPTASGSGLMYCVLQEGDGPTPAGPQTTVKVHYTGYLPNGRVFDSSVQRGEPAEFPLSGVIPGWTEGVGDMAVGEKRKLIIPSDLAYGANPPPGIPPHMPLIFDVELLEITSE